MVGFGAAGDKEGPPIWMVGFGSAREQEGHPIWMGWVWCGRREGRAPYLDGWVWLTTSSAMTKELSAAAAANSAEHKKLS